MRRTLIGLAAAGLLVVSGCSDSDSGNPNEDAADESSENENADGGSPGADDGFCADFETLNEEFAADPEAGTNPDDVISALESLDPPDEIAEDFATLIEVSRSTADVDMNDPEAVAEAQELSQSAGEAQARVTAYLTDECGIDTSGGSAGG